MSLANTENLVDFIQIQYTFHLSDDQQEIFCLRLAPRTLELIGNRPETPPPWTRLEFCRCTNCTLNPEIHAHCPLSLNLVDTVTRMGHVLSYDKVKVVVHRNNRTTEVMSSAQAGVSSLMGLIMATSGCPHTAFFKPMARFHHPLASEEETLYRAASMYLLAQYFLKKEGKNAFIGFDGMEKIYENIQLINEGIAERLKSASNSDLSANAVIKLDMYAKVFPFQVQDKLNGLQYLFSAYLDFNEFIQD